MNVNFLEGKCSAYMWDTITKMAKEYVEENGIFKGSEDDLSDTAHQIVSDAINETERIFKDEDTDNEFFSDDYGEMWYDEERDDWVCEVIHIILGFDENNMDDYIG